MFDMDKLPTAALWVIAALLVLVVASQVFESRLPVQDDNAVMTQRAAALHRMHGK